MEHSSTATGLHDKHVEKTEDCLDLAGPIGKHPLQRDAEACETPAKKARGAQGPLNAQPRSGVKAKPILPEPKAPLPPPSAFKLLCKEKWPVLVGEDKDRLEQAKLMWKALPANDRGQLQSKANQLAEKYRIDMEEYADAVERYKKSLPLAERAALKQKEKDAANQRKAELKQQAAEDKLNAKEYRVALKNIGDRLKGDLQICKRGGGWCVPDGSVSFSGIGFGLFSFIFGGYRARMTPQHFTSEVSSVVGQLSGSDAGNVFGVTKIRGGSMYATYTIQRMTVSYQPQTKQLTLAYQMDGF